MKRSIFCLVLLMAGLYSQAAAQKTKPVITDYSFKFKVNGLKDVDVYLGFHFGDKKFIKDTAHVNTRGEVEFTGKDTLQGGIYLFITPRKNYFEFVVNERQIQMETDTLDLVGKMNVKKSAENTLWYDYMKLIMTKQKEIEKLKPVIDGSAKDSKEYKDAIASRDKITEEINTFRNNIVTKNPDMLVSKIFKAMKEPDMPEAPKNADGTTDSLYLPRYFKNHYWDNFDLSDNRIIRTPVFESKLVYFLEKVIMQVPDSVIAETEKLLAMTKGDAEMFKFICHHVTYSTERSNIMCMDAVFVYMVDTYYKTGKAPWVDQKTLDKMIERSDKLKPLLCGKTVQNITLPDTAGTWHSLYNVKTDITILYFWDATCGHCKKSTPVLKELYNDYLKPHGYEIFGVEGELEDKEWIKYTREQKLPWINVSDNPEINTNAQKYIVDLKLTDLYSMNFRHHFDLTTYPVVYILDKDKKIIAKKLGVEQIKDFVERYMKNKDKKPQ